MEHAIPERSLPQVRLGKALKFGMRSRSAKKCLGKVSTNQDLRKKHGFQQSWNWSSSSRVGLSSSATLPSLSESFQYFLVLK